MIRRFFLKVALLLALLSTGAAEQRYLPSDCTALVELLPPPPAEDSIAGRADLETVLQVQADRTTNQIQRAKRVASQTVSSFARPVLGEWFDLRDFPRTKAIFDDIDKERRMIVDDQVKMHWKEDVGIPRHARRAENHPLRNQPALEHRNRAAAPQRLNGSSERPKPVASIPLTLRFNHTRSSGGGF